MGLWHGSDNDQHEGKGRGERNRRLCKSGRRDRVNVHFVVCVCVGGGGWVSPFLECGEVILYFMKFISLPFLSPGSSLVRSAWTASP